MENLQGFYIYLIRSPVGTAHLELSQQAPPLKPTHTVSARAGPFLTAAVAEEFQKKWAAVGKEIKRTDWDKGYEKVGRLLAENETPRVGWAESWQFLERGGVETPGGGALIDLNSGDGLEILERFLREKREKTAKKTEKIEKFEFRKLDFGILDGPGDSGDSESKIPEVPSDSEDSENSDASDVFYDTFSEIPTADDTLGSIIDRFAAISIYSPRKMDSEGPTTSEFRDSESSFDSDDDASFVTPPTTPPPTFVADDEPCKIDNDLFEVLIKIPAAQLTNYPLVAEYVQKVSKMTATDRSAWLPMDSPRRCEIRRKN
ncbi:hypothetical protein CRE_10689 [Caenorhabditis remanei]|uniref:ANKLE2 third alpha/beta domain-containing protein n=1 Tax=Caenorhabditis remanei TaxID=31234 RepID=E3NK73_CAERE|nr:hypothetical protein CRE_10689 [Caenorhabditis remanei]